MKYLIVVFAFLVLVGCGSTSSQKQTSTAADLTHTSSDPNYGYSEDQPVLLGGFLRGTKYAGAHIEYFESLLGPNGEEVSVRRLGSCCGFEDSSLPLGGGMLDQYELSYSGQEKPVVIFVNLYRFEQPKAPMGFALL
jgi:hypothetical protein